MHEEIQNQCEKSLVSYFWVWGIRSIGKKTLESGEGGRLIKRKRFES